MSDKNDKWFWKGKRVSKKVYELRCKQKEHAKTIKAKQKHNLQECPSASVKKFQIEGRRIIHLDTMAKQLYCIKCKAILSSADCVDEKKVGLASTLYVKCRLCQRIKAVDTDKKHQVDEGKRMHYDVNIKAVVGLYTILNKLSFTEAIIGFYEFLYRLNKKCILRAHNCKFDYTRLIVTIKKVFMMDRFQSVVEGFCDTLSIISKFNKQKGKGVNKLQNLASTCKISIENAHNAVADVTMLKGILSHFKVDEETLKKTVITWVMTIEKEVQKEKEKANKADMLIKLKTFEKCDSCLSAYEEKNYKC